MQHCIKIVLNYFVATNQVRSYIHMYILNYTTIKSIGMKPNVYWQIQNINHFLHLPLLLGLRSTTVDHYLRLTIINWKFEARFCFTNRIKLPNYVNISNAALPLIVTCYMVFPCQSQYGCIYIIE